MPTGDSAFLPGQRDRIERALATAESETGLPFALSVGPQADGSNDLATEARGYALGFPEPAGGVVIMIDPGARKLEIATSGAAHRRIADRSAGLAALSMTSRIGVGDVTGAIVDGIRMLAEAAGRGDGSQPQIEVGTAAEPAHATPALPHGH